MIVDHKLVDTPALYPQGTGTLGMLVPVGDPIPHTEDGVSRAASVVSLLTGVLSLLRML